MEEIQKGAKKAMATNASEEAVAANMTEPTLVDLFPGDGTYLACSYLRRWKYKAFYRGPELEYSRQCAARFLLQCAKLPQYQILGLLPASMRNAALEEDKTKEQKPAKKRKTMKAAAKKKNQQEEEAHSETEQTTDAEQGGDVAQ